MDYIPAGTTNKSIQFKLSQAGLTVASILSDYVRWDESDGTSFEVSSYVTLTALASISTSHTDNYGIYLSTFSDAPASFLFRADFPDAAFAAGKERVICSLYEPGNSEKVSRIFRLMSDDDIAEIAEDTGTTIPAGLLSISTSVENILVDTGTTIPAGLLEITTDTSVTIPAGLLDISTDTEAILEDTGTTIPAGLSAITADTAAILEDTGTTIPAGLLDISTDTEAILEDTGTTIPASLAAITADTEDIQSRLPVSLSGGLMRADIFGLEGSTAKAGVFAEAMDGTTES